MLGLFGLSAQLREMERADIARKKRLAESKFVPWNPQKTGWKKELNLQGTSYATFHLFNVRPYEPFPPNANKCKPDQFVDSPTGEWRYTCNQIPAGREMGIMCGSKMGTVMFDAPVLAPAIYRHVYGELERPFEDHPLMSLTPMEYISMRPGTKMAKGHTVVAGLGLGHQLMEVCRKRGVKRVTLIEISQELVDWIMPRIKLLLEPKEWAKIDIIVGDAWEELYKMKADVALIDVFSSYGNNYMDMWGRKPLSHNHYGKVWLWGAAKFNPGGGYGW